MVALHWLSVLSVLLDATYGLHVHDDETLGDTGLHVTIPTGIQAVWVDIGTPGKSAFEFDLQQRTDVYLIGVEPTPELARKMKDKLDKSGRFAMFENVCSVKSGKNLTSHVHPRRGIPAQEINVTSVNLGKVLRQVPLSVPIQLLKIDIQGHGWPCLKGAAGLLDRVANVFVKVQDIESATADTHQNSTSLGALDVKMGRQQFFRQYCESSNAKIRELNCLYTRKGATPLWVTGRPRDGKLAVKYDLNTPPRFRGVKYIFKYNTTAQPGEMADKLQKMLKSKRE